MKLTNLTLKGYKSINQEGASINFGDITILLGANGVGKSNIVSFFSMLNYMMSGTSGALQTFVAQRGFANSFLYMGPENTPQIQAKITFSDLNSTDYYAFTLTHAAGDILVLTSEEISYTKTGTSKPYTISLEPAQKESDLLKFVKRTDISTADKQVASFILTLLRKCRVFHFHDTSLTAKMREQGYIGDSQYLNHDAGNLAAFLYIIPRQN